METVGVAHTMDEQVDRQMDRLPGPEHWMTLRVYKINGPKNPDYLPVLLMVGH